MEQKRFEHVAVVLPCYNEEVTIGKVVRDFVAQLPGARVYVFDNRSSDKTRERALEAGATVVFSPMQGKGNVVRHIFECVDAEVYVMADGDDTYPAEMAPSLVEKLQKQGLDMVIGTRMDHFDGNAFRKFHQFGNHLVAYLISMLFNIKVTDVLSGYRAFSRNFAKSVPLLSSGFEIETELTLQAVAKKFTLEEIPISYRNRPAGSFSKLNTFSDGILVIKSIFIIFKDFNPLVFYFLLSGFLGVLSLITGFSPIMDYFRSRFVSHVPLAILAASLGVLSILFLGAGLILDTVCKYHNENFHFLKKSLGSRGREGDYLVDKVLMAGVEESSGRSQAASEKISKLRQSGSMPEIKSTR